MRQQTGKEGKAHTRISIASLDSVNMGQGVFRNDEWRDGEGEGGEMKNRDAELGVGERGES